jgi:hypothetical protein
MYTPVATRTLVRLDEAQTRFAARLRGVCPDGHERTEPMADTPEDLFQVLRETSRKNLQFMINTLLANAEQTLVGLAGKARGNAEQSEYYEAIRELRLKARNLELDFMARVLAGFDALRNPVPVATPQPTTPKGPPTGELRIDGLNVIQDTLLEEQIAIDNIASRARHTHREMLLTLGRHVARELNQRRVDIDALPTGPQALCKSFMDACAGQDVPPRVRVIFSRLFTRFVIEELSSLYYESNAVFPVVEDSAAPQAPGAIDLNQPVTPELPTSEAGGEDVAQAGATRMESTWDTARTPLLAPPGKAMAMPRNLIDEMLETLQERLLDSKNPLAALNPRAGIQPLDLLQLVNDTLVEQGHTRPMALPGDVLEAVNLLRMLFEHALRNTQVPSSVRRLIRLLQVPMLRAALRDADVLSSAEHPARALLKEIGAAAGGAMGADEDFQRLLQLLITRLLNDYDKDVAVFRACLEDLRRYLRSQDGGGIPGAAMPGSATGLGREGAQVARAAVSEMLGDVIGTASLPRPVLEFLRGPWSDALFVIRSREGAESSAWGLAAESTTRLVAATRPDRAPGAFAIVARGLVQALVRAGTDEASATTRVRALDAAVTGEGGAAEPASGSAKPAAAQRPPASTEFLHLVDRIAPDTWVEFREPGGQRRRAKVLNRVPRTGSFVFVNDDGSKAGEIHRAELAAMIENAEAKVLHGTGGGAPPGRPGRR